MEEVVPSIGFPLIIKPRNGPGGGGITKVENIEDLHSWYSKLDRLEDQIIQPYISGYDIDCSVLCIKGKIIASTIQKSLKYESDNLWPYGLEFQQNDEIDTIVKKVVELFKWSGVVHIDLRFDEVEKKIKLIEMNPRFWASVEGSIFAGVNFPYLSCLIGLKRELPPLKLANKVVFRTGPAIKATLTRFLNKSKGLYYDNTYLKFIVKDPIPNFAKVLSRYFNKLKIYK